MKTASTAYPQLTFLNLLQVSNHNTAHFGEIVAKNVI